MLGNLSNVLSYLYSLFSDGKAYSTINIHRSMLSVTLDPINGHPVGSHPLVIQLFKGIYNSKPPQPKYSTSWDADAVLAHLGSLNNNNLTISQLSQKLVTLLALATLFRSCELTYIDLKSISFSSKAVSFSLTKPSKGQRSGPLRNLSVRRFADPSIDPVSCMDTYIKATSDRRSVKNSTHLFIGSVRPYGEVKPTTVAGWIKKQLGEAGIDTAKFTAHSTRSAAGSKAIRSGAPIQAVLDAGHWAAESTFSRFYLRDHDKPRVSSVSDAVLNPLFS